MTNSNGKCDCAGKAYIDFLKRECKLHVYCRDQSEYSSFRVPWRDWCHCWNVFSYIRIPEWNKIAKVWKVNVVCGMQVHHRDLTQFFVSVRKNTHAEISAMGIRNRDMTSNFRARVSVCITKSNAISYTAVYLIHGKRTWLLLNFPFWYY